MLWQGVISTKREELSNLLGIRLVYKNTRYLGAPTIVGRSKKEVLSHVLNDRVWKKLKGWKEKFLARARKEFLLKLVIKVILTYLTSIFKPSGHIMEDIHHLCAHFWWGSVNDKRKIH